MAASCVMKQVEERHVATEISNCVWSPKMDLVAISNILGHVAMHRLSWQRVWVINSPSENIKVKGLAWRPDSKVLAIGYSSGEVLLVDIEDSSPVHRLHVLGEVTSLTWALHMPPSDEIKSQENPVFEDSSETFLPPLPPLSKTYSNVGGAEREESWQEGRLLKDQSALTLLTVATAVGTVHLYAFGLFHCATIKLNESIPGAGKVLDAAPSHDFHLLSCILERDVGEEREVVHATVDTLILAYRHRELRALAYRYGKIYGLMTYASHTLNHLAEAWESILLELDSKLAKYASSVPEGGVSADFLDLLVFGLCSPEFNIFLGNELTEKALKKLGHSIELSYSNIQKLVLRNVQAVGQALVFHLSHLVGLARRHDRFGILGVEESVVTNAVREAGAFVLKAVELQQVIVGAMNTFKAFLRWLYVVVKRVLQETVPDEISRMTQQDLSYIAEFLHDSLEDSVIGPEGKKQSHFRLERVGQYLKDEALSCPAESQHNPWVSFLKDNPAIAEHSIIFPHYPERSLLQEHKMLAKVLDDMAGQPANIISDAVRVVSWVPLVGIPSGPVSVTQISCPRDKAVYSVILPGVRQSLLHILRWPTEAETLGDPILGTRRAHVEAAPFVFSRLEGGRGCTLEHSEPPAPFLQLIGAQFYTEETLSVLAQDPTDPRICFFIQLWMVAAIAELRPMAVSDGQRLSEIGMIPRDAGTLVDASGYRRLDGGPIASLAVSGSRKVALLLSENLRRVRLFEMEVEEDDEDDDEEETAQHESIMNASGASDDPTDNM